MKNYWFLLLGIGFVFAASSRTITEFSRILSNSSLDAGQNESLSSDESIQGDNILASPITKNNSTETKNISSFNRLNIQTSYTITNKLEIQRPEMINQNLPSNDPFIENSFVTTIDNSQKKNETVIKTGLVPDRIVIPEIKLDAPIIISRSRKVNVDGNLFDQWLAPNLFAAGWQSSSAHLGEIGNTVINGHHNEFGEVFGKLINLESGDKITIYSGEKKFDYVIANRLVLPERKVDLATRISNARWIQTSEDERLTLVTCWPRENNTHRLILVAVPVK